MHCLTPFQSQPSLGPHIQETHQFASKAGRVVRTQTTQRLQIPAHSVESGFIQTEDISGKGGECCGDRLGTDVGQLRIDTLPQFLQGKQPSTEEPFDQAIACEPDRGKRAILTANRAGDASLQRSAYPAVHTAASCSTTASSPPAAGVPVPLEFGPPDWNPWLN